MRISPSLVIGTAFACCTGYAAASSPDPVKLFDKALEPPDIAYQGHMTVTHWYGKYARVEEVRVYFMPPNLYRWEFLAPDGTNVDRIVKSNGDREEIDDMRRHRKFIGEPVKNYQKLIGEKEERELLLRNYDLTVAMPDSVAGRKCWILEIIPKESDKHRQRIWIDQQTGAVLQVRRFRPEGRFTTLSRFVSFEPKKNLPSDLFVLDTSSGTHRVAHGLDPNAVSLQEFKKSYGKSFDPPTELPAGFVFESANNFKVRSKDVWHLRYTDGLASLSLFLTQSPVSLPKNGQLLEEDAISRVGPPVMYGFGKVLEWKKHGRHYLLIGDLDKSWLEKIAAKIP